MNPLVETERRTPGKWWTDFLHLTYGCSKYSVGCKNCWALEKTGNRVASIGIGRHGHDWSDFTPRECRYFRDEHFKKRYRSNKVWFVSPMSDMFHDSISDEYIRDCFNEMFLSFSHNYVILTKRSGRMSDMIIDLVGSSNTHLGISIENQETYSARMYSALEIAKNTSRRVPIMISLEPILEEIRIEKSCLAELKRGNRQVTVIVGAESGSNRRKPPSIRWVANLKHLCDETGVDFIFKQWPIKGRDGGRIVSGSEYINQDLP